MVQAMAVQALTDGAMNSLVNSWLGLLVHVKLIILEKCKELIIFLLQKLVLCISSRPSVARTLMACSPRLFQTLESLGKKLIAADLG